MTDSQQPPEKQPPKKRVKRKTTKKPPAEEPFRSELEDALSNYLKTQVTGKKKSINNIKTLESLLTQYLNSFILIGYAQDTQEYVSIVNAPNEQSADSLSTALNKFISKNSNRLPDFM